MAYESARVDVDRLEKLVIDSGLTAKFAFAILGCVQRQNEYRTVPAPQPQETRAVHG
jgi:hypothetical protein